MPRAGAIKVDELVEIADPGETSILLVPGQPGYGAMRQISKRMPGVDNFQSSSATTRGSVWWNMRLPMR